MFSVACPVPTSDTTTYDALKHPDRAAGEVQTGDFGENWGLSTGSSSSNGGEEKKSRDQKAEVEELRAQVEQLRRQQRGEAGQEG